nr:retrovirus-related Pol polyprotein from transposon TNT 1-94 [Tanacetum cinerariifolium]
MMYGIEPGIKYPRASELGHCLTIISASYVTVPASCQNSTLCVRKYCASDLSSCAGSKLGSELTSFAGSELGLASYRLSKDYFPATCEQELCPFNFLLANCQVSSNELNLASYRLIEDYFPATCEQELCLFNFLLIQMYCRGKENGVNILKSIDEGSFWMGTLRETLTEGTEGALHLGPERP